MALMEYDPYGHIDPDDWLALDEFERIRLVRLYHRKQQTGLLNSTIHAATHVIVESHVALGGAIPVQATLFRLMREGLDRHEAIHAIGEQLAEPFFAAMIEDGDSDNLNADYFERLKHLTAKTWRQEAS